MVQQPGDRPSPDALREAAWRAMARSHSPYSKFPVGAAIEDEHGRVHVGANIECVAYPLGACAEATAIGHMVMAGGTRIRAVAVTAERLPGCTPCGGCRQRLAEFADADVPVYLCDGTQVIETVTLGALLPKTFDAELA